MWLSNTWLSQRDLRKLERMMKRAFQSPVPTQMMTNGEFMPLAQTRAQREVEEQIKGMADT